MKGLIFLTNYITMIYGKLRYVFFHAQKYLKKYVRNAKKYKIEKIIFGGNKNYGKKILLSLHGRQCKDA